MKITKRIKNLLRLQSSTDPSGERDLVYMRDLLQIDKEIGKNEHRLQALLDSRKQAEKEYEALVRLCDSLEQNLVLTESKHVSRLIVGQLSHQLNRRDKMDHQLSVLNENIRYTQDMVETLKHRQATLKTEARQYFQREKSMLSPNLPETPPCAFSSPD